LFALWQNFHVKKCEAFFGNLPPTFIHRSAPSMAHGFIPNRVVKAFICILLKKGHISPLGN